MNFTLTNIQNRTVLAQCCLADMATRALEYRAEGDQTNAKCVTQKAFMLQFIIKRLRCFLPSIGTEVYTESFTVVGGLSIGDTFSLSYSGFKITPATVTVYENLSTTASATLIAASINAYNSDNKDELYATAIASGTTFTVSIRVSPRVTTDSITITASVLAAITIFNSNGDGLISQLTPPRLSNANAKNLLGLMDAYCGCPCGTSDAKITNDSISFLLEQEP